MIIDLFNKIRLNTILFIHGSNGLLPCKKCHQFPRLTHYMCEYFIEWVLICNCADLWDSLRDMDEKILIQRWNKINANANME